VRAHTLNHLPCAAARGYPTLLRTQYNEHVVVVVVVVMVDTWGSVHACQG
jgi:hypothetical protein